MSKKIFAGEVWLLKPSALGERWIGDEGSTRKINVIDKVKVMGITMIGEFEVEDLHTGELFELPEEHFEKMVGKFDLSQDDDGSSTF